MAASGLVEKATSGLLLGPDRAMNLEICDHINYDSGQARDVLEAIKRRLGNKNPKVQLLALTVLETLVKNCGEMVHQQVAEKDILHEMVKIVKKKSDMNVRDKILVLLDSWQEAFGGLSGRYPQYYMAYDDLRRSGVEFPERNSESAVPIFTPPPSHSSPIYHTMDYGSPGYPNAKLDEVMAASRSESIVILSSKDMDDARSGLEVLSEMLNALDSRDRQALSDDLIVQLVEQCRSNQRSVMEFISSTSDESLLCQGLSLNDDLQRVLAKHDAIALGTPLPRDPPAGLKVLSEEEEEAEDEFSHLAHRSTSRTARTSQEDRTVSSQFALPPPPTPIKRLNPPPSAAQGKTVDLLSGVSFEGNLVSTPVSQMAMSPTNGSVASPLSELQNPSNPFLTSPSEQIRSLAPSNANMASASSEYNNQYHSAFQGMSSGYVVPWASPSQQVPPVKSVVSPPGPGVTGIPPPPMLFSERQRFFEEQTKQVEGTVGKLEQQASNLTLQDESFGNSTPIGQLAQKGSVQGPQSSVNTKKELTGTDRLFEDLVDFSNLSSNFKTAGMTSRLTRPNTSKASGV